MSASPAAHQPSRPRSSSRRQAIGVRPETSLARQAGLALGKRGGISVDDHMRTSDPHIYAVGDAVEVGG